MDINKNSYIFGFATILIVILSAILSTSYMCLKPFQKINIDLEKQQNILNSIGINIDRDSAKETYSEYIKEEIVLDINCFEIPGNAFELDLAIELKKDERKQKLPLFICELEGKNKYIIPLRGKGLWGPIWGFIALDDDLTTIFGAVFDHSKETPGLGAEINTTSFQDPFRGKTIFEDEDFTSITVIKGGAKEGDMHGVDAISGGTITSNGVSDMIQERLSRYLPYFKKKIEESKVKAIFNFMDTTSINYDTLQIIQ